MNSKVVGDKFVISPDMFIKDAMLEPLIDKFEEQWKKVGLIFLPCGATLSQYPLNNGTNIYGPSPFMPLYREFIKTRTLADSNRVFDIELAFVARSHELDRVSYLVGTKIVKCEHPIP